MYDLTSSYLEGECNELGAYGYNRDGKRGLAAPGVKGSATPGVKMISSIENVQTVIVKLGEKEIKKIPLFNQRRSSQSVRLWE